MLRTATIEKYQKTIKKVANYMQEHEVSARQACDALDIGFSTYYSQKAMLKKTKGGETSEKKTRTKGKVKAITATTKDKFSKNIIKAVKKDKVVFFLGSADKLVSIIKGLQK